MVLSPRHCPQLACYFEKIGVESLDGDSATSSICILMCIAISLDLD